MAWHKPILDELHAGRSATVEHKGPAMFGRIEDGQLATVAPATTDELSVDDLVFVYVQGNHLIRLISAVESGMYHIADTRGKALGHVAPKHIHGKVVAVSTPKDLIAALTIDDQPVSPFNVWIHHQSVPYPGGHEYLWHIPHRLVGRFSCGGFEPCQTPNQDQQRHWLYWLQPVLRNWSCNLAAERGLTFDHIIDYRYVLNTITSLAVANDQLVLSGACSPFVRGH